MKLHRAALLIGLVACSTPTEPIVPLPAPVATVIVLGVDSTLMLGRTARLSAVLRDSAGRTTQAPVTWSSSNISILTVSDSGLVTAIQPGRAVVTAVAGNQLGTREITVVPPIVTVSSAEVEFGTDPLDATSPPPTSVQIAGARGEAIDGLTINSISYSTELPTSWLKATLSSTTAPATLVLTPNSSEFPRGEYTARVSLRSTTPGAVQPPEITVRLIVGGYLEVRAGQSHACARSRLGRLFCWGLNDHGQVGDGSVTNRSTPVAIAPAMRFVSIAPGYTSSCGIREGGEAYCWGSNNDGALGDGTRTDHLQPAPVFGGAKYKALAVGQYHACGLRTDGAVACWGTLIGAGAGTAPLSVRTYLVPTLIPGDDRYLSIAAGSQHTCGITTLGRAQCWGDGQLGELGDGTGRPATLPVTVAGGATFTALALGAAHSCGLTSSRKVYCWGMNSYLQVGDGTDVHRMLPTEVAVNQQFSDISSGTFGTCATTSPGRAYCWGEYRAPYPVSWIDLGALTLGWSFSCYLPTSPRSNPPLCWGMNWAGQLGVGTTSYTEYAPSKVNLP